jgi:regulator of protease activity HflC (stomatin/prohibitin superfamily)
MGFLPAVGIALLIFLGIALLIRLLALVGFYWCFIPANTFAIVVSKGNTESDLNSGGGVVNVLHNIPGKVLNMGPDDPMEWVFETGTETRGLLFHLLGVQRKGLFTSLRVNQIRDSRFARTEKDEQYHIEPKNTKTKFVFYSGANTVSVTSAETIDALGINADFNILFERSNPIKSILMVADANAVLTLKIRERVISVTGKKKLEDILGGTGSAGAKDEIQIAAKSAVLETLTDIGITVKSVDLFDVSVDAETKTLIELKAKTERENAAKVSIAKAVADAQRHANDAEADRITRTILPIADNPGAVRIRLGEAYRDNKTVTTFAPGGSMAQIISGPNSDEKKNSVGFKPESPKKESSK